MGRHTRGSEAKAFKTGLVTAQSKYEQVHQPHAEQRKQLDEREPANRYSQQQSDILLSHPGSLTRPKPGGPVVRYLACESSRDCWLTTGLGEDE